MENTNGELFRIARKGGYEREDVDREIAVLKKNAAEEKNELQTLLAGKEKEIAELQAKVSSQSAEIEGLRKNISEKYQSYIDHYDTIGETILDSRIQAKKIIEDAYAERELLLKNVKKEIETAKEEIRQETIAAALQEKAAIEKQTEGKKKEYKTICNVIAALVEQMDAAQESYGKSIRTIHSIAEGYGIGVGDENAEEAAPEEEEPAEDPWEEIPDELAEEAVSRPLNEAGASPAQAQPEDIAAEDFDTEDAQETEFVSRL